MKFSKISLSALLAAALIAVVGSVAASNGKNSSNLQCSREQVCGGQYSSCMFSGRPMASCMVQRENCLRGGSVLGPVLGARASAPEDVLPSNPNAEQDATRFKALLAKHDSSLTKRQYGGNTYCWKMLMACDAGNASACDRFERYCQPQEG